MSSQRGTNQEWASAVNAHSSQPNRDFELLDDLKILIEQRGSTVGQGLRTGPTRDRSIENASVPRPRAINSPTPDQLPLTHEPHSVRENLPRLAPSDQNRVNATSHEEDNEFSRAHLTRVQPRLQSSLGDNAEPFPAGLHFLRQRQEPTHEVTSSPKIFERRGLAVIGYAVLAIISAGGISFAAVQLLSERSPNIKLEESRTTGIRSTIPAINQPVAMVSPRLRLSKVHEVEGKPVSLGISIENQLPDSFIFIRDVPPGSLITKGSGVGSGGWRVPLQELAYAMLIPPQNFVGTMVVSIDLKNGDDTVTDSDVQQLSWSSAEVRAAPAKSADASKNPRVSSLQDELPVKPFGNSIGPDQLPVAPLSVDERQRPRATEQPARQIPQNLIGSLLARADTALETGDIAAARLLLQRAAEAGDVKAAMSLASTYDPAVLRRLRTLGAQSDLAEARRWYKRAAELGSMEAILRLKELH